MNMLLTTVFRDIVVKSGTLFDIPTCCLNRHTGKCAEFYKRMFDKERNGVLVKCPYGLVACRGNISVGDVVATGLRVKNITPKSRNYGDNCYLPMLNENVAKRLIEANFTSCDKEAEVDKQSKFVPNLVHSLSKLLDVSQSHCESLLKRTEEYPDIEESLLSLVNAVMSARVIFNADDVRAHGVSYQSRYEINVHGKFLKMVKLFRNYQGIRVNYNLSGEVKDRYQLYPSFECVPYLLLENARKYAPNPKEVDVVFQENELGLSVEISNSGPLVKTCELNSILEYGVRGECAKQACKEGSGIGLNAVKEILGLNGVELSVSSSKSECVVDGIPYGRFAVNLFIPASLRVRI